VASTSFRLSYGKFDYFNGGDLPGVLSAGQPQWHDVESPVAKRVGPCVRGTAIMTINGYVDSLNEFFPIGALRPRVWFLSGMRISGHPDHPGLAAGCNRGGCYSGRARSLPTDTFIRQRVWSSAGIGGRLWAGRAAISFCGLSTPRRERVRVVIVDDYDEEHG